MGYGAYIRCNCFKKGRTKPFKYAQYLIETPEGFELNLPAELKGSNKEKEMKFELWDWEGHCCEHEDSDYYSARICNNAGMGHFISTVSTLNGQKTLPTLYKYLPNSNDGYLPLEENENFKKDLLNMKNMGKVHPLWLYYKDEEGDLNGVANTLHGKTEIFFLHPKVEMGLNHYGFFISEKGKVVFESANFSVEKIAGIYFFEDKDTKANCVCDAFFNEKLFEKMKKVSFQIEEEDIDINEAHGYIIDTLLTLIEKSNEVGNPICWA